MSSSNKIYFILFFPIERERGSYLHPVIERNGDCPNRSANKKDSGEFSKYMYNYLLANFLIERSEVFFRFDQTLVGRQWIGDNFYQIPM